MEVRLGQPQFGLDPLIAEAKQRARRRRFQLIAATVLLMAAGAGAFAVHALRGGGGGSPGTSLSAHYQSSDGWSINYPRGMHVEHAAAASPGRYSVDETTFASFRSKRGVRKTVSPGGLSIVQLPPRGKSGRFPSDGIALRVVLQQSHAPFLSHPAATRLPLDLSSFTEVPRTYWPSTGPRAVQHSLYAKGQSYLVQVWIGREASSQQRALVDRMLATLSVRRVRFTH